MTIDLAVCFLPKKALKRQALKTANICYDMVICLSDQQLATGIGILIAGLKKLYDGSISTYHFRIVMHLAAITASGYRFSILAFFAWREIKEQTPTLTSSRRQMFRGKLARVVRVLLVVTLDVLYLYCAWNTADDIWKNGPHCPAECVLGIPKTLTNIRRPFASTCFTIFSYVSCGITLRNLFKGKRQKHVRTGANYYFDGITSSKILQVTIHVMWYGYDTWLIMRDLNDAHAFMIEKGQKEDVEAEYSMSFGQIVPVFLLILPILQLLESLSGKSRTSYVFDFSATQFLLPGISADHRLHPFSSTF